MKLEELSIMYCICNKDISIIVQILSLKKLSFSNLDLDHLPENLGNLINLEELDLYSKNIWACLKIIHDGRTTLKDNYLIKLIDLFKYRDQHRRL